MPVFIVTPDGIIEDITMRKKMEKECEKLATTDPLTGAKNRRSFLQSFE
jgi:GGDEF domain-containing protein